MTSWWPPSTALSQKLESLLSLGQDTSYFPADAYEERRGRFLLRGAALVLAAVAAHIRGLTYPWLWTDLTFVPGNVRLHSLRGMAQFWIHPLLTGQAPLAGTILYVENLFFNSPLPYHIVSLLAHAASCLLLWLILRRLETPGAWLAAAIFAVHPIEVQSVSWVSRQPDVLACVLGLGSVLAFLRLNEIHPTPPEDFTIQPPAVLRLGTLSMGLFLAAVLCQPSCFMLAAVFAILLAWKRGGLRRDDLLELSPYFVIAFVAAVLGFWFAMTAHVGGPAAGLRPLDRILIAGRAACFYVVSLLCPAPLAFIYPRWHLSDDLWMVLFPAALLAAIAALWWGRRWIGSGPLAALLCYLCLLLPHVPLVRSEWMAYSFVADHLQYLAGIPIIALLAAALVRLAALIHSTPRQLIVRVAGGSILLCGLAALSWFTTLAYSSEMKLWESTVDYDRSALAVRGILSQFYLKQGHIEKAADQFPERIVNAMQLQASQGGAEAGGAAGPLLTWGNVLEAQHRFPEAAMIYQQVLEIDPFSHDAAIRLAWSYKEAGDNADALRSFSAAVNHYPGDETLQNDFGLALQDSGNLPEAIEHFRQAIAISPDYVSAHLNLCMALFRTGHLQESSDELQKAWKLDPRSYEALFDSGVILAAMKNYAVSENMFIAALQIRPDSADAYFQKGLVQEAQGHFYDAIQSYVNALKIKPDFPEATDSLTRARAEERAARQLH